MWHEVILFMCISSSMDDPPESHRLEPVGVQCREVEERVGPNRDADESGAHSLVVPGGALLLVLERLLDGGLGERVLLVDGDEGVLRARVRAREAPVVAQRRGRLLRLLGREMVEAARVEADHGPRRRAGRAWRPVCVLWSPSGPCAWAPLDPWRYADEGESGSGADGGESVRVSVGRLGDGGDSGMVCLRKFWFG